MMTIDLSSSLAIAATPEKFGSTSKATKKASHPSRISSFTMVKLVHVGWSDDTVRKVMIRVKSSPDVAVTEKRNETKLTSYYIIILSIMYTLQASIYLRV